MRRRDFIVRGGAAAIAVACSGRAFAQRSRARRVIYFTTLSETDSTARGRIDAVRRGLAQQGWIVGQNVELITRWLSSEVDKATAVAQEIIALSPDVIIPAGTPATRATIAATNTIPVAFTMVSDPVGDGFVSNLARPEANVTGFMNFENQMGGKWLGLLKELRPNLNRVGVIANPDVAPGGGQLYLSSVQSGASRMDVSVVDLPVRTRGEIDAAVAMLADDPNAGLVSPPDSYLSPAATHTDRSGREVSRSCNLLDGYIHHRRRADVLRHRRI